MQFSVQAVVGLLGNKVYMGGSSCLYSTLNDTSAAKVKACDLLRDDQDSIAILGEVEEGGGGEIPPQILQLPPQKLK